MSSKPSLSPFSLIGMGASTAACILVAMALGYWVGEQLGAVLPLTFVGLAVGIAAAVASVRAQFKRYM